TTWQADRVGHVHAGTATDDAPPRRVLGAVLAVVVLAIAVVAALGMVALWPDPDDVPQGENPYAAEGVSTVDGTVTRIEPFDCNSGGRGPNNQPSVAGDCARVSASTGTSESAEFLLDAGRFRAGIEVGDDIQMVRIQPPGQSASYEFLDFRRG